MAAATAITDLASFCAAVGFEPEDLKGSTEDDLAELFEEYEVKGKAKIQIKKQLRLLPVAGGSPASTAPASLLQLQLPEASRAAARRRARWVATRRRPC